MGADNDTITLSVASSDVTPAYTGYDNESGNTRIAYSGTFAASSSNVSFGLALTAANLQSVWLYSDKGGTIVTNGTGTADGQTVSISGTPTGGFFGIGFLGQVTVVPYNVSAAALQTALQALSTIGSGNVTCSGGALPGTPIICTFAGALATGLQPLLQVYSGQLTGGSSPTVSVAHTVPGLPSTTIVLKPGIPLAWGISMGWGSNPFTANVTGAYFSCSAASRLFIRILSQ